MKLLIPLCLAGMLSTLAAQDADNLDLSAIGRLPTDRRGVEVDPAETNPYGLPTQRKKEASSVKKQYSQEDRIRDVLASLPVTGVIGDGKKVLLGDLVLEEGEFVDDVLPGQTDLLLVKEISSQNILIEWVEQSRRNKARQMEIPIDMVTRVQVMLKGQLGSQEKHMGIARIVDEEDQ